MRAKLLQRRAAQEQEIDFQGIPVVIEWPKGSTRTGVGKDGKDWYRKMEADYGFVPDTEAKGDAEDLDVYIGPSKDSPNAYVMHQLKDDGSYDEPKVVLGCDTFDEAKELYLAHYPEGWENTNLGGIQRWPIEKLRRMVEVNQGDEERAPEGERFIRLSEVRDAFYTKVLPRPAYQQALRELGGGQAFDDLELDTQNAICQRGHQLENGPAH